MILIRTLLNFSRGAKIKMLSKYHNRRSIGKGMVLTKNSFYTIEGLMKRLKADDFKSDKVIKEWCLLLSYSNMVFLRWSFCMCIPILKHQLTNEKFKQRFYTEIMHEIQWNKLFMYFAIRFYEYLLSMDPIGHTRSPINSYHCHIYYKQSKIFLFFYYN